MYVSTYSLSRSCKLSDRVPYCVNIVCICATEITNTSIYSVSILIPEKLLDPMGSRIMPLPPSNNFSLV